MLACATSCLLVLANDFVRDDLPEPLPIRQVVSFTSYLLSKKNYLSRLTRWAFLSPDQSIVYSQLIDGLTVGLIINETVSP